MFYVYMLASGRNGTLYTGHTDGLLNRMDQHKAKALGGFTARYGVDQLVWFEEHLTREAAFRRERQIKEWKRFWKIRRIEATNPMWKDLTPDRERILAEREMRALREIDSTIPARPLLQTPPRSAHPGEGRDPG